MWGSALGMCVDSISSCILRGPLEGPCYMGKSTLKMTGSKSLGDTGFLQFLGLFQVIMANPVLAYSDS